MKSMSSPQANPEREQSRGEELANSISHGAGFVAVLVATPFLILHAIQQGRIGYLVGACIFAASMLLLYLASTLYHALPPGKFKQAVRIAEHCAIYILIAGTYTPFFLGVLNGTWGWTMFGVLWGLAAIGIMLKIINGTSHLAASTIMYLLMGWLIVVAIDPLYTRLPTEGLLWLVAGGVAYTAGVPFFAIDTKLRYGHFIWHLFVMTGTTCHYFAVLWYAA